MRRARRKLTTFQVDLLVAVPLFALMAVELTTAPENEGAAVLNVLGALGLATAVAWRRRAPQPALVGIWVVAIAQTFLLTPVTAASTVLGALLLVAYAAGSRGGELLAWLAPLLCVGGVIAVDVGSNLLAPADVFFPAGMALASWFAGRVVRQRTRLAAELHEEAVRARERREQVERDAVAEERRRIAREMHDVIAHSVSVMVVQAGGARRILESDPGRAARASVEIERAGRDALTEMRRLLDVLRHDEDPGPIAHAPQPTLDGVDALVRRARDAGLPVTLRVEGEPRPAPLGMDLAAYRILQEGVTNALKHTGGALTEVRVTWGADCLELEVADHGPGPRAGARRAGDGGHGLIGMRERVRLYDGELETGRRRGGGFRVLARLPLERSFAPAEVAA